MIQGDRRGTGEKAVYEVKTESVTLTGPNAEVYDKEQGTVHGTRLVMNTKGDSMAAEGQTGGRAVTKACGYSMSGSSLTAVAVSKSYKGRKVVHDVSLMSARERSLDC